MVLDTYGHNLYGDIHQTISFRNNWCYIRSYLLHVGLSSLYHSVLLMACYRFFRIILYKYKQLETFQFVFKLVLFQWLMGFISMIPFTVLHWNEYVPEYYFCEMLISNYFAMLYISGITYLIPVIMIALIYIYIIYYITKYKRQTFLQNRQKTIQRDLLVLRQVIILIGFMISLCFPSAILWLIFVITGYVNPISYQIGWPSFALLSSILPTTIVSLTPKLRQLIKIFCKQNHRIQPM
ncbi:hypothetical protein I4U23_022672 [Adineta vaga]|nr:hypothetical protein I4U23_022672 [Adineta vaga]